MGALHGTGEGTHQHALLIVLVHEALVREGGAVHALPVVAAPAHDVCGGADRG